jgi:D-tyrosyl-tRNA(Tyr) deacylase
MVAAVVKQSREYFEKQMEAATTGRGKPTYAQKYKEGALENRDHYGHNDSNNQNLPFYITRRHSEYR